MERLHVFLRDEYVPKCRETVGRSALPNGEEWYDYMIRHHTTTFRKSGCDSQYWPQRGETHPE